MNQASNFHAPDPTVGPKLTSWKNEPTLSALKGDLEQAKPSHDAQMVLVDKWNDLSNVSGKYAIPKVKGRSSVQPKLIRRQAEWRYSALTEPLLGSQKLFSVTPNTFEDAKSAEQNELVLNWQFRTKINKVKFVDDLVRATVDEGTCILRLGWKRSTTKVKQTVPVYSFFPIETEEQLQALQSALDLRESNPRAYDETVPQDVKAAVDYYDESGDSAYGLETGTQEVDVEKVLENRPTIEVMNLKNVIIDPSCLGDINRAYFAAVSFETSKAELEKEGSRYKNLNLVNWEDATPINEPTHATSTPTTFNFKDPARKRVLAYEYWGFADVHGNGELTPFVATWIGNTMIRMEESPFPDKKLPFVIIPYLPVKRALYGEPDAELLEDNQLILGAVTRGIIDLLGRSANGQQGMAKGLLDPLNKRRFDQGQDYEFNPQQNPQHSLIEHKYPEIPQSALTMLGLQNQDAESLSGVKGFSGGMSGEAYGDVAAGIRGMLDAASKREMAILRRIAKGLSEAGVKICSMNSAFLSDKEVVRVTNEEFVTVVRDDLVGDFDLIVDISTAEIDDAKAKDLGFMLQTIGPNTDQQIVLKMLAEIAKLKRMPELAKMLETFEPKPNPMQQQLQQLEIEKAQLEIEKLKSEVSLNKAKEQVALANADSTDQNTVDKATGMAHSRSMELQQGQAQGNQNLQVTKALTAKRKEGERDPDIEAAIGFNQLSDKMNTARATSPVPALI